MHSNEFAFIVEGSCEYVTYYSIVSKIIGGPIYFPISNAQGVGNIVKNTERELENLLKVCCPRVVIITLDLDDVLDQKLANNCVELIEMIKRNFESFISQYKLSNNCYPEECRVIVVDKCHETWICADLDGLKRCQLIDETKIDEDFINVDKEIHNPKKFLESKLHVPQNIKKRNCQKLLISNLNPKEASKNSRSFRKFYKEISSFTS